MLGDIEVHEEPHEVRSRREGGGMVTHRLYLMFAGEGVGWQCRWPRTVGP